MTSAENLDDDRIVLVITANNHHFTLGGCIGAAIVLEGHLERMARLAARMRTTCCE